ncbi:hypothetical protein BSKO_03606 [Bryopsis sp. KO-2023]|nr:hypothetical protein BSKO_03606 [Bryopsis sp. KO-2023]
MCAKTPLTVPIPSRSFYLNILAVTTSLWIGACVTNTSPHHGPVHALLLLVLTLASIMMDGRIAQAFGTRFSARQSESQGIIEGALALPWFFSGMKLLDSNGPSKLQFHESILASSTLLASLANIATREASRGSYEMLNCETGGATPLAQQKKHSTARVLTLLASCLILVLSLMEIRSFGVFLETALLTGSSMGVYFLVMYAFPSTFTVGEGWIISQGATLLFLKSVPLAVAEILTDKEILGGDAFWSEGTTIKVENARNWSVLILAFSLTFIPPLSFASRCLFSTKTPSAGVRVCLGVAAIAWGGCGLVLSLAGAFRVLQFVFRDYWRIGMVVGWMLLVVLGAGVARSMRDRVPNIILRKWFHFLAVVLFLPGHMLQPELLEIALACAFAAFLAVEGVRFGGVPVLGSVIHNFLTSFTDERDSGSLIWTHFSLLLGMAVPIWVFPPSAPAALSGVVVLGIGDSAAAIIGSRFGKIRMHSDGDKTMEGTLANFIFCLLAWSGLIWKYGGVSLSSFFAPTLSAAIYEASSSQLDNMFVPLYYSALLLI